MSTLTLNLSEKLVKDIIESDASLKAAWAASKHVYGDDSLSRHWSRSSFVGFISFLSL